MKAYAVALLLAAGLITWIGSLVPEHTRSTQDSALAEVMQ